MTHVRVVSMCWSTGLAVLISSYYSYYFELNSRGNALISDVEAVHNESHICS